MELKTQKWLVLLTLLSVNLLLSVTFILYIDWWYLFMIFLSPATLLNASSAILILAHKMFKKNKEVHRKMPRNYLYVIPCYNETKSELLKTLNSIANQRIVYGDKRLFMVICDGSWPGQNSTDKVLKEILGVGESEGDFEYKTWSGVNTVTIYKGLFGHGYHYTPVPYILAIKKNNVGKRDSLTLLRQLCYRYNKDLDLDFLEKSPQKGFVIFTKSTQKDLDFFPKSPQKEVDNLLTKKITKFFDEAYEGEQILYIIGIDADTEFEYNCSYELIQGIESEENVQGCVGYVEVSSACFTESMDDKPAFSERFSVPVLFQYSEYLFAQCLRRHAQSLFTKKVNCLSGCNQILRVSRETCGPEILAVFNRLPAKDENIFNHIRSYASEDRNHVCHMLSMFPESKTVQTLKAISYTNVPRKPMGFMAQRRRWTLGAMTNDMLLLHLPSINIFERISAAVNIFTFCLNPFVFVATIFLVRTIILYPTVMLLYLSVPIMIPLFYSILIPVGIKPMHPQDALYFYLARIVQLIVGGCVNVCIYGYALSYMDVLSWGRFPIDNTAQVAALNHKQRFTQILNHTDEYTYDEEFCQINEVLSGVGQQKYKIGVCGVGFVGNAVMSFFTKPHFQDVYEVFVYDKYKNINTFEHLLGTDVVFVCLPTNFDPATNTYDMGEVDSILYALIAAGYMGVVILKSTVLPTYCSDKSEAFSALTLVHNPEFLTARTAVEDFENQEHIILGLTSPVKPGLEKYLYNFYAYAFPDATISTTSSDVSGLVKLVCNSFYATKVQFFTEIYLLCLELDVPYGTVKDLCIKNGWISPQHTSVPGPDSLISFGGLCLPKDISALNAFLKGKGLPCKVLNAAIEERNEMRQA